MHTCRACVGATAQHEVGDDLDPQAARAEAACRSDDDAAVARAEIDHVVGRTDRGEFQHRERDAIGRGDEGHFVLRLRASGASTDERDDQRPRGAGITHAACHCGAKPVLRIISAQLFA